MLLGAIRLDEASVDIRSCCRRGFQVNHRESLNSQRAITRAAVIIDCRNDYEAGIVWRNIVWIATGAGAGIGYRVAAAQPISHSRLHVSGIALVARLGLDGAAD